VFLCGPPFFCKKVEDVAGPQLEGSVAPAKIMQKVLVLLVAAPRVSPLHRQQILARGQDQKVRPRSVAPIPSLLVAPAARFALATLGDVFYVEVAISTDVLAVVGGDQLEVNQAIAVEMLPLTAGEGEDRRRPR
jgi:hypothetical protein